MNKRTAVLLCLIALLAACSHQNIKQDNNSESDQAAALKTMQKHLTAVSDKDLDSLTETLPGDGKMQLILPGSEIKDSVAAFLKFHQDWFEQPGWTFETKILNSKVGPQLAMVIVEIVYRDPRPGSEPYFNRMIVSYVLEKTANQWYVIKDHASSVEKSTDSKERK